MKRSTATILLTAAIVLVGGYVLAQPASTWSTSPIDPNLAQQTQRACIHPTGGWTIVNCSNSAAASSASLNAWTRYLVQCGDDSYFAPGSAASGQDADSNDGWVPAGAWYEFITTDTVRFYSCLNKNSDSDCRHIECK